MHSIRSLYYGWKMLVLVALAQMTSWGVLYYSFSVFLTPMQREFGWSTATVTGAFSLALLISGVAAVPVGRSLDRHGPRVMMSIGSACAFVLTLAWASVNHIWSYYLVWCAIGIVMATIFYEPAFQIVAVWFVRKRARAFTLLTFVAGFASVVYLPLSNWLLSRYGWREALLILAVVLLCGTLPIHAFALRRGPAALGLEPDGERAATALRTTQPRMPSRSRSQALHDPPFWWMTVAFVLATLSTMAITVYLIPYLVSEGYSTSFAAAAAGMVGALALPGRLVFTPLGGRIPRQLVTAAIFATQMLALLILVLGDSRTAILLFVPLFGLGFGAITPARAALVADMYGAANYGSINGVLALFVTLSRAITPVGAGLLVTHTGYGPMLWTIVVASGLATVAALMVKPGAVNPIEPNPSEARPAG